MGLAIAYILLSSASFALNQASVRRGMLRGSALQGVYSSSVIGVVFLLLAAAVSAQLFRAGDIVPTGYLMLAAAGVNHFILGRYCNHRAIGAIGANRARVVEGANAPFSILLAVALLSEEVTALMWGGIALVMLGPVIVFRRSSGARAAASAAGVAGGSGSGGASPVIAQPTAPPVKYVEGYLFGVLNAASWSISPLLIRSALEDTGLGVLGSLTAYAASTAVLLPLLALPSVRRNLRSADMSTGRWFVVSAFSVVTAQMFRYLALSVAPVTIVVPIMRASSVLLLPVSYLINRRLESFEPRVILGVLLSIAGSLLVVL
ncbi:MAG: EamA family transporter [Chloroflexota bacterium]|nr:EamA family transporter [Chloroflexota bacterium]